MSFDESLATDTSGAVQLSPIVAADDQDVGNFTSALSYRFTSKGTDGTGLLRGAVTSLQTSSGTPVTLAAQALQGDGGTDLFTLDPATGVVTLTDAPLPGWSISSAFQPYLSAEASARGMLVRAEYVVEVEVSDRLGAVDAQSVRLVVSANSSSIPIVRQLVCNVTGTDAEGQEGAEGGQLPTRGGAICTITGTGLGSDSAGFSAWGVREVDGAVLGANFTGCSVRSDGMLVTCDSPVAFGEGFSLRVMTQGQMALMGETIEFGFARPTVTSVGPSAQRLNTEGGTEVEIMGANLGPASAMATVTYEDDRGDIMTCVIKPAAQLMAGESTHDTIRCITSEGSGTALQWTLRLNGEEDLAVKSRRGEGSANDPDAGSGTASAGGAVDVLVDATLAPFSYASPTIAEIRALNRGTDLLALQTTGGDVLVIEGANFGPATEAAQVMLTYAPES